MEAPSGRDLDFTAGELRSIRTYIARRTGLTGEYLTDAVADGLLALVERGAVYSIREAKFFAFIGAVDAHRRRTGRSSNFTRLAIARARSISETETDDDEVRYIGVEDVYPAETDVARIIEWARTRPERTRHLVWLVLQGYTFEEAGTVVGISPSRVTQLIGHDRRRAG